MLPHHIKPLLLILALLTLLLTTSVEAKKKKHRKHKEKIHVQWAICDLDAQAVLQKLGQADKAPFKIQNVTYFDSVPPQYSSLGLGFRTKLHDGVPISMVKYRFNDKPAKLPEGSTCVWDRYGHETSYTCSVSSPVTNTSDLWSSAQQTFANQFQEIDWASLKPYGPYLDPKWKFRIHHHKVKLDDAIIKLPDGRVLHLMEIEMSAKLKKADKVHERITDHLLARGVVLCGPKQLSKTARLFKALNETLRSDGGVEDQVVLGYEDLQQEL